MAEIFRRVEKKYIINKEQYLNLKEILNEKMIEDEHGKSTICNIYFDTGQFDLIRNSIEKPYYKDKVRLRSYNIPNLESSVFLEIKKKCGGIVGKRRIQMLLKDYYEYINNHSEINENKQVIKELNYYFQFYHLKPTMFLSYYRRAYYEKDNRDLRITFDSNIVARDYDLQLEKGNYGENILEKDKYIMEIKTLGAMPMWLVKKLNELNIRPGSFSKYGKAYEDFILDFNQYQVI